MLLWASYCLTLWRALRYEQGLRNAPGSADNSRSFRARLLRLQTAARVHKAPHSQGQVIGNTQPHGWLFPLWESLRIRQCLLTGTICSQLIFEFLEPDVIRGK